MDSIDIKENITRTMTLYSNSVKCEQAHGKTIYNRI